jgi:phosphoribosylformylglycinamidine cyclo-ligase
LPRDDYASAGVDLAKVSSIHASLAASLSSTFAARKGKLGEPVMPIGHYAGLVDIGGGTLLALHTDGVGTKVLVAEAMKKFDTVGIDCIAMTVNDLVCMGCEPVAVLDYIALERENPSLVREIAKGLVRGAKEAGVAIVGGETAVMGDVVKGVGGDGFDLVSMGVGLVKRERLVDGSAIREGDAIVGVKSTGLHSNGYTLARKVLLRRRSVGDRVEELGETIGEAMLRPTRIYVKPALEMLSRCEVHGIGHITGGAFTKLTRLVGRRDLGFALDKLPSVPIFSLLQREGRISDAEMYKTFNMGVGLCVVAPPSEVEGVISCFEKRRMGANKIGALRRGRGVVVGRTRIA